MSKELRIYKPTSSGKGFALKLQQTLKKEYRDKNGKDHFGWHLFAEFAPQLPEKDDNGNARFAWRQQDSDSIQSVLMKFSELDAAKLLLVLNDEAEENSLFHDPNKAREESDGNKSSNILKIKRTDKGYQIEASGQVGKDLKKTYLTVSWDEAILLKAYLNLFIERYYS